MATTQVSGVGAERRAPSAYARESSTGDVDEQLIVDIGLGKQNNSSSLNFPFPLPLND